MVAPSRGLALQDGVALEKLSQPGPTRLTANPGRRLKRIATAKTKEDAATYLES
jgi:hypothetical protein